MSTAVGYGSLGSNTDFLKEHKKVEEQQSKIDNQQTSIAELKATVAQQQKGMEVLRASSKSRPRKSKKSTIRWK